MLTVVLLTAVFVLGSGTLPAREQQRAGLVMTTSGWSFDLVRWEADALTAKVRQAITRPADTLALEAGSDLVRGYLDRAQEIARLEAEVERAFGTMTTPTETTPTETTPADAQIASLQAQIDALRAVQDEQREVVEQVIQRQVAAELTDRGLTFPPVQFTFVEPPKKLVVSPRDRIATDYYRMLRPEFDTERAEAAEAAIREHFGLSAYVTRVGGLGAYPSMVVERASLPWVMSTVAHEWVHNYLTLFPLGLSYNASPALTTINETVADIVGDEIGAAVVRRYYPDLAPPETTDSSPAEPSFPVYPIPPSGPMPFDFGTEMRRTRLIVDTMLAQRRIDDAEAYMEWRRQWFVDNGYNLRKLNQAYFAFHGSYGTSAASTNPLGPILLGYRAEMPDVAEFLRSVRSVTSVDALERAIARAAEQSSFPAP